LQTNKQLAGGAGMGAGPCCGRGLVLTDLYPTNGSPTAQVAYDDSGPWNHYAAKEQNNESLLTL